MEYNILGQVIECLNPPEDISNYVCQNCKVKLYRPRYDTVTGIFLGLCKTVGYLDVQGDPNEHFLSYGFWRELKNLLVSS